MIINLSRGGILIIDLPEQELTLETREGRLWITKTGGSPDYVLNQGEECRLAGPGEVFIEALCQACLEVCGQTGFAMKVNDRGVSPENRTLF